MSKDQERIAELEAQLDAVQSTEAEGKDPETVALATKYARQAWYDIQWVLDEIGVDALEVAGIDIDKLKEDLIDRKYNAISGANKTATSW